MARRHAWPRVRVSGENLRALSYKVQAGNGARASMVDYLKQWGQRKMAQWALAYAAGAWIALQAIRLAASGVRRVDRSRIQFF